MFFLFIRPYQDPVSPYLRLSVEGDIKAIKNSNRGADDRLLDQGIGKRPFCSLKR